MLALFNLGIDAALKEGASARVQGEITFIFLDDVFLLVRRTGSVCGRASPNCAFNSSTSARGTVSLSPSGALTGAACTGRRVDTCTCLEMRCNAKNVGVASRFHETQCVDLVQNKTCTQQV